MDGDGQTDYTLNPCPVSGSQAHTFFTAGSFTAKLVVQDAQGSSIEKTFALKMGSSGVNSSNQNPVIASFTASPTGGPAPFKTQFAWQISDPNPTDTLTCKLDVDNNGSYEYVLPGCSSATGQSHIYTAVGGYTARLQVEDGNGGLASQSLGIGVAGSTPNPSGPDVRIGRVDWGQSVVKQNLRLVQGKPALIRAYVYGDRLGLSTALQAQVYRSGVYQGTLSMVGPSSLPTGENMGDLSSTFNATVPASWVQPGLEVRLLADPNNQLAESDETNNTWISTPSLMTQGTTLYLTAVPINYTDTGASNTLRTPTMPTNFQGLLTDLYPLKDVQTQTRAAYNFSGNLRNSADWSRLLSELRNVAIADKSNRYYYGFVHPGYSSGVIGIGYVGLQYAVGWDAYPATPYTNDSAAWVMAHEIGHNFGRGHAPCGASNTDPSYPYTNAALGTWGFMASAGILMSPSAYKDVMSYCNPQWISDYTYTGIQDFLEQKPSLAASVSAQRNQLVLFISGRIQGSQTALEPLLRLESVPNLPQAGPYTLRYQTASGWQTVPFSTYQVAPPHTLQTPTPEEHFAFTLPNPGEVLGLEIWRGSSLLLKRNFSLSSQSLQDPGLQTLEAQGQLKITWLPAVYPYLTVAHLGQTRTTLVLNQTGGEAVFSTQDLPSGGSFEVVLSNGASSRRWVVGR